MKKKQTLKDINFTKKQNIFDALEIMLNTEVGCSREQAIYKLYQEDVITKDSARHIIGKVVDTWERGDK